MKISQFPLIESADGSEQLAIVKDGANGKMKTSAIIAKAKEGLVPQIAGKGLSTNDYTNADKTKLDALPIKAELDTSLASKQPAITASDDIAPMGADKLALTDRGKHEAFDTLWLNLCGSNGNIDYTHIEYGEVKPYLLNGIYLTRYEAIRIVMQCRTWGTLREDFAINSIATNIPELIGASSRDYSNSFSNIRVVNMALLSPKTLVVCLNGSQLISILNFNALYLTGVISSFNAPALVTLDISNLKISLDLSKCPLIDLASWQGLVTRAANTEEITVTVHADVYAKLTGDTTNAAAAALSADELAQWQALIATASAKQITFATT